MMINISTNEMDRLNKAKESGKYGHLLTWKELFCFQKFIAKKEQVIEISNWAKRRNKGENVTLPLMNYTKI